MRLFLVIFAVEALAASWIEIPYACAVAISTQVEALAASWIEITRRSTQAKPRHGRSPCGFVD